MQKLSEVVGVTYGEFQGWYNYGEIRLATQRLFFLEEQEFTEHPNGGAGRLVSVMLGRLPQLSLDDEEGILLVRLKAMRREAAPLGTGEWDVQTVLVPIENVEEVIPLTERARRILDPRVRALGVRLSPAYFKAGVQDALGLRGARRGLRGGDALVDALFYAGSEFIDDSHRNCAVLAVRLLDKRPSVDGNTRNDYQELEKWLRYAFSFTRHDSYDEGNLGYLIDAGKVLKQTWDGDSLRASDLGKYREIVKDLRSNRYPEDGLHVILADGRIADYSEDLRGRSARTFSEGLAPLVMFLRWKDLFHKNNDSVNFEQLLVETRELVGSVGIRATSLGVWLLGCFAGYDGIAPDFYRAVGHGVYPWYSGPKQIIEKIGAPLPSVDGADGSSRPHEATPVPLSGTDSESHAGTVERVHQLEPNSVMPAGEMVGPNTAQAAPSAETVSKELLDRGSEQPEPGRPGAEDAVATGPAASDVEFVPGNARKVAPKTKPVKTLDADVPRLKRETVEATSAGSGQERLRGRRKTGKKGKKSPESMDTHQDGGSVEPGVGNSDLFDSLPRNGSNESGAR